MYKTQLVHRSLIGVRVWVQTLLQQTSVLCDDHVHVLTRLCCARFVACHRAGTYFVSVMSEVSYVGIVQNAPILQDFIYLCRNLLSPIPVKVQF